MSCGFNISSVSSEEVWGEIEHVDAIIHCHLLDPIIFRRSTSNNWLTPAPSGSISTILAVKADGDQLLIPLCFYLHATPLSLSLSLILQTKAKAFWRYSLASI